MEPSESDFISIEVCQNCRLHKFCTRHDEKKYEKFFADFSILIKNNFPSMTIIKNQNNDAPQLGAFEITFRSELIFSKIKTGKFPDLNFIIAKIKSIQEGNGNLEDSTLNNSDRKKKKEDNNKKKEIYIPKYDILSPSPTKIYKAYKMEGENSMQ